MQVCLQQDLAASETSGPSSVVRFSFEAKPVEHPPLCLEFPARSTAAVNAGDYRLYVGGLAINGAFAEMLHYEQGLGYDASSLQRWEQAVWDRFEL